MSRSFDERVEIDYGGDDFHDPTTNVRRRCALAIAKQLREVIDPRMHDQPDHEGQFMQAIEEQARTKNCNLDICEYKMKD